MQVAIYNQSGAATGNLDLDPKVFAIPVKEKIIAQVAVFQQASARRTVSHTKTRAYVRGGGKKPWKQKGTGRARAGSIRSPLWRGGGIIFGPRKDENYSIQINRRLRRQGILMALSLHAGQNRIVVVESFPVDGKTKTLNTFLNSLPIAKKRLLISENPQALIGRASKNMLGVEVLLADNLNLLSLLNAEQLVISKAALETLEKIYGQEIKRGSK